MELDVENPDSDVWPCVLLIFRFTNIYSEDYWKMISKPQNATLVYTF
jgi:hypothetical protein